MFGLTTLQLVGLSVTAALVTTAGSLLALVLREYFLVRSFDRWKERRALLSVYRRYRDPILLAGEELERRLAEICEAYPTNYLLSELVDSHPPELQANSADDPYFRKYRLVSTVYRLCTFLGWLELYRQDVTFLDTGSRRANRRLEDSLKHLRSDMADGELNKAADLPMWRDRFLFREEQRAVGEGMIAGLTNSRAILGYGALITLFANATADGGLWWLRAARNFLLDLGVSKDFRRERLRRMQMDLHAMCALLKRDTS